MSYVLLGFGEIDDFLLLGLEVGEAPVSPPQVKKGLPWLGPDRLLWEEKRKREEMMLAAKLQEELSEERRTRQEIEKKLGILQSQSDAERQIAKEAIQANIQLIQKLSGPSIEQVERKAELMRRLDLAHAAKEAKRKAEEEKKREFVKRMAKARKKKK